MSFLKLLSLTIIFSSCVSYTKHEQLLSSIKTQKRELEKLKSDRSQQSQVISKLTTEIRDINEQKETIIDSTKKRKEEIFMNRIYANTYSRREKEFCTQIQLFQNLNKSSKAYANIDIEYFINKCESHEVQKLQWYITQSFCNSGEYFDYDNWSYGEIYSESLHKKGVLAISAGGAKICTTFESYLEIMKDNDIDYLESEFKDTGVKSKYLTYLFFRPKITVNEFLSFPSYFFKKSIPYHSKEMLKIYLRIIGTIYPRLRCYFINPKPNRKKLNLDFKKRFERLVSDIFNSDQKIKKQIIEAINNGDDNIATCFKWGNKI